MENKAIMIIAGEVSGDQRAAGLVRALKVKLPGCTFFGIGGPMMRGEGVQTLYDVKDMAVMGFLEVFLKLKFFKRVFHEMLAVAAERKPAAVILVDYPGFNLRFAAHTHLMGIKTLYYICPQVWAWNRRRIPAMARNIDHLISIFPFEKAHFHGTGLKVDFVGHPLVTEIRGFLAGEPAQLPWQEGPKVALLPGSRIQEIERILPVMLESARLLKERNPSASFIVAASSDEFAGLIRERFSRIMGSCPVVSGKTWQVLRQADAAMVTSGTATVEAAILNCPMIVVYKTSLPSYLIARSLIRISDIGMVNLIAGRRICPELVQADATSRNMADALEPLLSNTPQRTSMLTELEKVRRLLGDTDASEEAAEIVANAVRS